MPYVKVLTVRGSLSLALGLSDGTPILRHWNKHTNEAQKSHQCTLDISRGAFVGDAVFAWSVFPTCIRGDTFRLVPYLRERPRRSRTQASRYYACSPALQGGPRTAVQPAPAHWTPVRHTLTHILLYIYIQNKTRLPMHKMFPCM